MLTAYSGAVVFDVGTAFLIAGAGFAVGAGGMAAFRWSERVQQGPALQEHDIDESIARILAALPGVTLMVDPQNMVADPSVHARVYHLVDAQHRLHPELVPLANQLRRGGIPQTHTTTIAGRELRIHAATVTSQTILLFVEDISEAQQLERLRRDFIANTSHELKTPLGSLSLLVEALTAVSDDPEQVRLFAQRIAHESTRLAHLIQDVTDLSRVQSDAPIRNPETFHSAHLIGEAVQAVTTLAEAKDIHLLHHGSDVVLLGEEHSLVTALRNLLVNAIHYSPHGTHITITTEVATDTVRISVADQGIGIAEAEQERIFERFYRVDPARSRETGGTGLGLAIVKHICRQHGGVCHVWSEPGVGSTFTLELPRPARNEVP